MSGVFFAPLEWTAHRDDVNQRIVRAFDDAHSGRPARSASGAVPRWPGVATWWHRQLARRVSGHQYLLARGCRRVAFVGRQGAAPTVDAREAGYREALRLRGVAADPGLVVRIPPDDTDTLRSLMHTAQPDGIVCANDRIAAHIMRTLLRAGIRIPQDVQLIGIDDADYAALLPVPLTTLRQPRREIGDLALAVMLDRLARPALPARHVQLQCEVIVRESDG